MSHQQPHDDLAGHLTFALRYEGLALGVLKPLFKRAGPEPIADIVDAAPTGAYGDGCSLSMNGCSGHGSICPAQHKAPMPLSSTASDDLL
ncbi:MAG: hypothetical protein KKH33_08075 [Alphaproteobacteria bacterium]|nr:hypothetical protein [Alphaproteobacteria bacterium]